MRLRARRGDAAVIELQSTGVAIRVLGIDGIGCTGCIGGVKCEATA